MPARADRRDEDIREIAAAVAGKFDHYVCRRDDGLRGRASDEVPKMIAEVLRAKGVSDSAITIIPDEQEAIDHALRLGRPGDLLLIFADALTRSWKQVTKFKPDVMHAAVAAPPKPVVPPPVDDGSELAQGAPMDLEAAGFVRDERGLRYVGEAED